MSQVSYTRRRLSGKRANGFFQVHYHGQWVSCETRVVCTFSLLVRKGPRKTSFFPQIVWGFRALSYVLVGCMPPEKDSLPWDFFQRDSMEFWSQIVQNWHLIHPVRLWELVLVSFKPSFPREAWYSPQVEQVHWEKGDLNTIPGLKDPLCSGQVEMRPGSGFIEFSPAWWDPLLGDSPSSLKLSQAGVQGAFAWQPSPEIASLLGEQMCLQRQLERKWPPVRLGMSHLPISALL